MSERNGLKDCPFCGSDEIDPRGWLNGNGDHGPQCNLCGATAESDEAWNRRASLPAIGCTKPGCFPYCDCGGIDDPAPAIEAEQAHDELAYKDTIERRNRLSRELRAAQQSAPELVSVPVELLRGVRFWLERTNEKSDEDIAELLELRAILASPEKPR